MQYRNIFSVISVCFLMVMQTHADGHIITLRLVEEPVIAEAGSKEDNKTGGAKKQENAVRSVVLTVDTVPGNEYRVQAAGNLLSGSWDDLGDMFTATHSNTSLSFPESDARRFFRVIPLTQPAAPSEPTPPGPPPSVPPSAAQM